MHTRRFLCSDDLAHPPWHLAPEDARHARRVLRLSAGDKVTLLDGRGGWCQARLTHLDDRGATAEPDGPLHRQGPPPLRPWLLVGAPDPAAFDEVAEHAAELGAWALALYPASRSPAPFAALRRREERWSAMLRASVKQSGNLFMPQLRLYEGLEAALLEAPPRGWLLSQGADPFLEVAGGEGDVTLAVGPEGDFTEGEREALLRHNLRPAALGPHTLRVETAALAGLAVLGPLTLRAASSGTPG